MTDSKVLSASQVKNLLNDNKGVNRNQVEPQRWPGDANLLRLAKAFTSRSPFVVFGNGTRFKIKYDAKRANVLIKPSTGEFAPMGYFSYKQLEDTANAAK